MRRHTFGTAGHSHLFVRKDLYISGAKFYIGCDDVPSSYSEVPGAAMTEEASVSRPAGEPPVPSTDTGRKRNRYRFARHDPQ